MIVPMAVILTGMIFYLTFYLYNQCIVAQDTYILAFRGSLCCGMESGEVNQLVLSESTGKFGAKYIGVMHFTHKAEVNKTAVTVEAKGTMTESGWGFGARWQAQRICPVECVRKVRLGQKIKAGLEFG